MIEVVKPPTSNANGPEPAEGPVFLAIGAQPGLSVESLQPLIDQHLDYVVL